MCVHNWLRMLMCNGGVSSLPSPPPTPPPMLLPSAYPDTPAASTALAACVGLPEPACSPSPATASMGSLLTHHPLLTQPLSLQAPGAGRWCAAAGAPRQAPPPLHGQLHQHQVRGVGSWGAAATALAVHSHPGQEFWRDWAVVGMGVSVLPGLTRCPLTPWQCCGPCTHLPHPAEPPEPLTGRRGQPGW